MLLIFVFVAVNAQNQIDNNPPEQVYNNPHGLTNNNSPGPQAGGDVILNPSDNNTEVNQMVNTEPPVALNNVNPQVQVQQQAQVVNIDIQQVGNRSNNVNYNPYNQQKAGQSIRPVASGGGSYSGSSGVSVNRSNKQSLSYKIKKALDRSGRHHKKVSHYSHKNRVHHCAGF